MFTVDLDTANIYDLAYLLNPGEKEVCAKVDPYLAKKVSDMDDLHSIYYYLCYGNMNKLLPHTGKVINSLLFVHLRSNDDKRWWEFKNFYGWLSDELLAELAGVWLDSDSSDKDAAWIVGSSPLDSDLSLKALEKLTFLYRKNRGADNIKNIEKIFINMTGEKVIAACEIISNSTPAIAISLLKRSDVREDFTLTGLKALSKLKKQREIDIKIDFNMLINLGPKSRLNAMKQLFGMLDKYYLRGANSNVVNPFKTIPSRDEVELFLFPCCLEYNDQVVDLVKRYDKLISQKGGE